MVEVAYTKIRNSCTFVVSAIVVFFWTEGSLAVAILRLFYKHLFIEGLLVERHGGNVLSTQ